jgi:nucleoside transporter
MQNGEACNFPSRVCSVRVQQTSRWGNYAELGTVFFLHGAAMAMWFVPLSTVLDAHGLQAIKPFAFAASALAAFISPLIFGAIADRHVGPVRVLRWLALATAAAMALAATAIKLSWNPWLILALIQVHALFSAPTWSITTAIVLERLSNPQREFGPVRAVGTVGWMAGCWIVSWLNADTSTMAGYCGMVGWLLVAAFTLFLPSVAPPKTGEQLTLKQRLGLDALTLLKHPDHRVVFVTAALVAIPLAAFYPFTPPHLRDLGLTHTSAWMTLGQITEIVAMFSLSALLANWRLKWIFAAGLASGLTRYILCALDTKATVLAGVTLHGFAFTLFFVTAPIYLNGRVDVAWRARAQALMSLMTTGVGNLFGYLGSGYWLKVCQRPAGVNWSLYWGGLAVAVAVVLIYFLVAYRGKASESESRRSA